MQILHISTEDSRGGAARAAYRLHWGLQRIGHKSSMYVARKMSNDPQVIEYQPAAKLADRLLRRLSWELQRKQHSAYRKSRPRGYEPFSTDQSTYGSHVIAQMPQSDVINLHWIAGFVDYESFFRRVSNQTPVVWTMHDMNPFTGGCHYDDGCGRFSQSCGLCPQLGSTSQKDLSWTIWRRKSRIAAALSPKRLHFVSPSRSLAAELSNSSLFRRFAVTVIPHGLDTAIFSPKDRGTVRKALDIPSDANIVMFAAQSVDNRRKGFGLLLEALRSLSDKSRLFLLSLGGGEPALKNEFRHLHLGTIEHDGLLSMAYSAADLFVIPSLQEAFGQTALEALACGTPVVGFDVGGIPDMVRPNITGYLAPVGDVRALRDMIARLLDDPEKRAEMSANCRHIAVEEYSLEIQARRYAELYESMLEANHIHGSPAAVAYVER